MTGAFVIRFGLDKDAADSRGGFYLFSTAALAILWWLMLAAFGSRDPRVLGSGSDEFKRVLAASSWLFGLVAVFSYGLRFETARGYVGIAFPAGVFALMSARFLIRQHLSLERTLGDSMARVVVVGNPASSEHLIRSFRSEPAAGYDPVGAYLTGGSNDSVQTDLGVPVLGYDADVDSILRALELTQADAAAISAGVGLHPRELRRLGWELAARDIGMILAPALTDVAGPRIHTQPVAGLPLIHVSTPRLVGAKRFAKRTFDVGLAGTLLLLLSPILLVIALLVKGSSRGPVFYSQERIGVGGRTFRMLKYRSMVVDADAHLAALLAKQGTAGKPLFKVRDDPRVTPIGRILRKYSLDEVPQLVNVLRGDMSLVGPRPQRQSEVELYDDDAHRRLFVLPGMSGLWQVSGRSNLTWEQSIRLDLYYVENWSLTGDIVILLKTFRAVFQSTGAI